MRDLMRVTYTTEGGGLLLFSPPKTLVEPLSKRLQRTRLSGLLWLVAWAAEAHR